MRAAWHEGTSPYHCWNALYGVMERHRHRSETRVGTRLSTTPHRTSRRRRWTIWYRGFWEWDPGWQQHWMIETNSPLIWPFAVVGSGTPDVSCCWRRILPQSSCTRHLIRSRRKQSSIYWAKGLSTHQYFESCVRNQRFWLISKKLRSLLFRCCSTEQGLEPGIFFQDGSGSRQGECEVY